jgi:hypothetical protein
MMTRQPTFMPGVTAGFGTPVDAATLADMRAFGWRMVRNGTWDLDEAKLAALWKNVSDAGLFPVVGIVRAAQASILPRGCVCELYAEDDGGAGSEPWLRFTDPARDASILNAAVPALQARNVDAYAACAYDLASRPWAEAFLRELDPWFRLAVHRYPPNSFCDWTGSADGGRYVEDASWQALLLADARWHNSSLRRRWAVMECGYTQARRTHWWNVVLGRHSHMSDADQAAAIQGELSYWANVSADFCVVWQHSDGAWCPVHPPFPLSDGHGIRRANQDGSVGGQWKPSASMAL